MLSSSSILFSAIGWGLLNSFWQIALLLIVYKLLCIIFSLSSSQKYVATVLLLTLSLVWALVSIFNFNIRSYNFSLGNVSISKFDFLISINQFIISWLPQLAILYLLILFVHLIRFAIGYKNLRNQYATNNFDTDFNFIALLEKCKNHFGITKFIRVIVSEKIASPLTIGSFKPLIIVPLAVANQLSYYQMEAVLLHELAHIKRNDFLINTYLQILKVIFYFNPFALLFIKNAEMEMEKSCDNLALQYYGDAHQYSDVLLKLGKLNLAYSSINLQFSNRKTLLQRVVAIFGISKANPFKVFTQISFVVCIAFLNFFVLHFSNAEDKNDVVSNDFTNKNIIEISYKNYFTPSKNLQFITKQDVINKKIITKKDKNSLSKNISEQFEYGNAVDEKQSNKNTDVIFASNDKNDEQKKIIVAATLAKANKILQQYVVQNNEDTTLHITSENIAHLNTLASKLKNRFDNIDWKILNENLDEIIFSNKLDSIERDNIVLLGDVTAILNATLSTPNPSAETVDFILQTTELEKQLIERLQKISQYKQDLIWE